MVVVVVVAVVASAGALLPEKLSTIKHEKRKKTHLIAVTLRAAQQFPGPCKAGIVVLLKTCQKKQAC